MWTSFHKTMEIGKPLTERLELIMSKYSINQSINLYLNQAEAHKTAPDRIKLLHYTHKHTYRQTERKMVHIKQEHTHTTQKCPNM